MTNSGESAAYQAARAEERLATDDHIHELGVHVRVEGGRAFLTGSVASAARKQAVLDAVRAELQLEIVDQIEVIGYGGPEDDEAAG
jgi:hypothetical protein